MRHTAVHFSPLLKCLRPCFGAAKHWESKLVIAVAMSKSNSRTSTCRSVLKKKSAATVADLGALTGAYSRSTGLCNLRDLRTKPATGKPFEVQTRPSKDAQTSMQQKIP